MTPPPPDVKRRALLATAIGGATALAAIPCAAAGRGVRFDRIAYERYIALMNAGDPRFADYYDDDIRFIMDIRGKAAVLAFYARQRPFVRETIDILFFCSDATGAAAEVRSELRCLRDCDDTTIFGRALKAGEVQRVRGCLLYVLNARGQIAEIKGPLPETLNAWRREPA